MAVTKYAPMFEVVSGALTKINKKSPHAADQKMVLTTHRVAPTTSKNCSRVYLRDLSSITRTTPVKASELEFRQRFAARLPSRPNSAPPEPRRPFVPTSGPSKPPRTTRITKLR